MVYFLSSLINAKLIVRNNVLYAMACKINFITSLNTLMVCLFLHLSSYPHTVSGHVLCCTQVVFCCCTQVLKCVVEHSTEAAIHHMIIVWDFLILLHPAASAFVFHSPTELYFRNKFCECKQYKCIATEKVLKYHFNGCSSSTLLLHLRGNVKSIGYLKFFFTRNLLRFTVNS